MRSRHAGVLYPPLLLTSASLPLVLQRQRGVVRGVVVEERGAKPSSAPEPARTPKLHTTGVSQPLLPQFCNITAITLLPPPHAQTKAAVLGREVNYGVAASVSAKLFAELMAVLLNAFKPRVSLLTLRHRPVRRMRHPLLRLRCLPLRWWAVLSRRLAPRLQYNEEAQAVLAV